MEETKVNCQNEGCTNAVPPTSKKYCSRRCKHQVACRASRARLKGFRHTGTSSSMTAAEMLADAKSRKRIAKVIAKPARALKRNYVRRVKTTDMSTPRRDGKCHMCPKKANYGRRLYCSDECRVASARAKFAARKLGKIAGLRPLSGKKIRKLERYAAGLAKKAKVPTKAEIKKATLPW